MGRHLFIPYLNFCLYPSHSNQAATQRSCCIWIKFKTFEINLISLFSPHFLSQTTNGTDRQIVSLTNQATNQRTDSPVDGHLLSYRSQTKHDLKIQNPVKTLQSIFYRLLLMWLVRSVGYSWLEVGSCLVSLAQLAGWLAGYWIDGSCCSFPKLYLNFKLLSPHLDSGFLAASHPLTSNSNFFAVFLFVQSFYCLCASIKKILLRVVFYRFRFGFCLNSYFNIVLWIEICLNEWCQNLRNRC